MPPVSKPGIDWPAIRARFQAGESAHAIAKTLPVSKQGIYKRAHREGWGQVKPDPAEVHSLVNARWTGELARCHSFSAERAAKILTALRGGATLTIASAAAGIDPKTLRSWRERSPGFSTEVDTAIGASALQNVGNIQTAANSGDWKAADRMLQVNPIAKDDFANQHGGAFGKVTVVFNINRASQEEIEAAHTIDVTPEQADVM